MEIDAVISKHYINIEISHEYRKSIVLCFATYYKYQHHHIEHPVYT